MTNTEVIKGATTLTDDFEPVGSEGEFPVGKGKRIVVKGIQIALWRLLDGFYAIDDACPHAGASLAFGRVEGNKIACPRHGSEFDLCSGRVFSLPSTRGVRCYPVQVVDSIVYVSPNPSNNNPPDIFRLP